MNVNAILSLFLALTLWTVGRLTVLQELVRAGGPWRVASAGWTLRPRELAALIGEEVAISDHPGIVVELRRVSARTAAGPPRGSAAR